MDLYPWVVVIHVVAIFLFVLGHGVSSYAMFKVKAETDRARLAALLDLSATSLLTTLTTLIVALVAGIAAGIMGGHFGRWWIWISLVLLIAVGGVMTPLAAIPMNAVRATLGLRRAGDSKSEPPPPAGDGELAAARAALRPQLVAALGISAIAVIIWLMEVKPF